MRAKRIAFAALVALALLALAGCKAASSSSGAGSAEAQQPKDYAQILHDARTEDDNEAYLIFSRAEDGAYTARDGYSADYEADQLQDEIENMLLPLLGLEEGDAEALAASVSAMMVRSYGVAIVKPAEGKTAEVEQALTAYVEGQRLAMQNYLEDQYRIAQAAKVETLPSGEVVLVCCENSSAVLASIKAALA